VCSSSSEISQSIHMCALVCRSRIDGQFRVSQDMVHAMESSPGDWVPISGIQHSMSLFCCSRLDGCWHLRNYLFEACWHPRIVYKPFASLCSFCKCCEVFKTQAFASFWGVSPYTCLLGSTWLAQFGVTSSVSGFPFVVARGVMAVAWNRFAVHARKTSPGGVVEALGVRNSVQE